MCEIDSVILTNDRDSTPKNGIIMLQKRILVPIIMPLKWICMSLPFTVHTFNFSTNGTSTQASSPIFGQPPT
jgi:hypothetical protein